MNDRVKFLSYSEEIPPAIDHLTQSIPTINIYVEDTGATSKIIWRNLLEKIVPRNYDIYVVTCGGKINLFKRYDDEKYRENKRSLFIIDSDLDLLTGNLEQDYENMYKLPVYCVENYLLYEDNIVRSCMFFCSTDDDKFHKNRLNLRDWKSKNEMLLKKLFVCYATVQIICGNNEKVPQNVGIPVNELTQEKPNNDLLSEIKINAVINGLYQELSDRGHENEYISQVEKSVLENANNSTIMKYVSGKTYLFKLIHVRIVREYRYISERKMLNILSSNVSEDFDDKLSKIVIAIYGLSL